MFFGLLTFSGYSQSQTVTGKLTDDSGYPIPGVNVMIKGTTTGTTTDLDGLYSISAPVGSILVFSFIGLISRELEVTKEGLKGIKGAKSKPQRRITSACFSC